MFILFIFFFHTDKHRRRNGTKPLLKTLFSDNLIQDRLITDYYFHVILYEDHDLTSDSISFYIARCLQEEAGIKYINYLEGKSFLCLSNSNNNEWLF